MRPTFVPYLQMYIVYKERPVRDQGPIFTPRLPHRYLTHFTTEAASQSPPPATQARENLGRRLPSTPILSGSLLQPFTYIPRIARRRFRRFEHHYVAIPETRPTSGNLYWPYIWKIPTPLSRSKPTRTRSRRASTTSASIPLSVTSYTEPSPWRHQRPQRACLPGCSP